MHPRANTLGILFNENSILLEEQEGKHSQGTGIYYRPIGGTIEFGERSSDALIREYKEELGVDINIKQYLTCVENIFQIDEKIGHEITQFYIVEFIDKSLYQKTQFQVVELNKCTVAKWIPIEDILQKDFALYPAGLSKIVNNYVEINHLV
ncbi:NUDIX hydrolase [Solibacillus sp. CAU 1738]|uniref:NUDIX hydrolase n=1 Tax=Solibacillus sp. CAU 1738 TaxID=3140363 RepID=UPI00326078E1